jgi:hypothetical protein
MFVGVVVEEGRKQGGKKQKGVKRRERRSATKKQ